MTKVRHIQQIGLLALLLVSGGVSWSQCNPNGSETGAASVINLSGQGNFSCSDISGDGGTMGEVSSFQLVEGNPGEWTSSEQVDKIYVAQTGKGSRCLYSFEPGQTAGYNLEPTSYKTILACSDDVDDVVQEPIASLGNGCSDDDDFAAIQAAVSGPANVNIDWVFGVGTTDDENDKTGLCVQGGIVELSRCDEQCIVPVKNSTEFPYNPDHFQCKDGVGTDENGNIIFPLKCRPCALTDLVPPPDGSKSYCWERSHQRAVIVGGEIDFNDFFIPVKTKSTGSLRYSSFEGSTCYQVTTTYRGRVYTYWTPSGCP